MRTRRDEAHLSSMDRDGLLAYFGMALPQNDLHGLSALVRTWLLNIPFHNIDLLASTLTDCRSLTADEGLQRCLSGLGGPCHVQALGFLALVEACGFEANLCSATIGHEGDHLLVRVTVEGTTYLCDVGNGQPYLAPFPLGRVTEVAHLGWIARAEPMGDGIRLWRSSPDLPAGKIVYTATPEPRRWGDFAEVIALHHKRPGFGPFLTGLRAVRIRPDSMDTLRDDCWTTYQHDGFVTRTVPERELLSVLVDIFRLDGLPLEAALRAWRLARGTRLL